MEIGNNSLDTMQKVLNNNTPAASSLSGGGGGGPPPHTLLKNQKLIAEIFF